MFLMVEKRLADVRVALPGKVTRVDSAKGLVDVKPLLQGWILNDKNQRVPVSHPVVPGVPVVWSGGGGFRATFPVAVNDTVLLIFADRSMDRWKSLDGEVDPQSFNSHGLADAIAIPGLRSFANPLLSNPTDRATFGRDSGTSRIEVLNGEIDLGVGASDFAMKANAFMTAMDTLLTSIAAAMSTIAIAAPAGGAPAGTAITTAKGVFDAAASSFISSLVKVL
jgi:hypothetical protein